MIIDCHAHYTTAPAPLKAFRDQQLAAHAKGHRAAVAEPKISDDEIRTSLESAQFEMMRHRGHDMMLFSPIAGWMGHHQGDVDMSLRWTRVCNDLIHRVSVLYPDRVAAVCQLPQYTGVPPSNCVEELGRCVKQLGFIGCNLNPDPSGGNWSDPPLTDPWWFPLYEKLVELQVPAMIHVSSACNANFARFVGSHYLNGDTTAFMQILDSDLFDRFPSLKLIIPHGGGAVPYHWGRYRGIAQDLGRPVLDKLLANVFFDTCVYHQAGINLLTTVIPTENILFGSELIGAVRGVDPETGRYYDDTRPFIEMARGLSEGDRKNIFETNVRRVFKRLDERLSRERRADSNEGRS